MASEPKSDPTIIASQEDFDATQLGYYLPQRPNFEADRRLLGGFSSQNPHSCTVSSELYEAIEPFASNVWHRVDDIPPSNTARGPEGQLLINPLHVEYFRCQFAYPAKASRGRGLRAKRSHGKSRCDARRKVTRSMKVVEGQLTEEVESVSYFM